MSGNQSQECSTHGVGGSYIVIHRQTVLLYQNTSLWLCVYKYMCELYLFVIVTVQNLVNLEELAIESNEDILLQTDIFMV